MKKILLVILGYVFILQGFQVERPTALTDRQEGMRAYRNFHTKAPAYTLDPIQIRGQLPLLFMYIPQELNSAIARYIPYRFPNKEAVVAGLESAMGSTLSRRMFVWYALAYEFGLAPFYDFNQGYFYFEQPEEPMAPVVLKGKRKDYRLDHLKRLENEIFQREKSGKLNATAQIARQQTRLVTPHPIRSDATRLPMAANPLDRTTHRNAKSRRRRTRRYAVTLNRCNQPFAQIRRNGSDHAMLASCPASILNHKSPSKGIPFESVICHPALVS